MMKSNLLPPRHQSFMAGGIVGLFVALIVACALYTVATLFGLGGGL